MTTLREWQRLPWDRSPKVAGWPHRGFLYKDGGVAKLRTPAGTVVNAPPGLVQAPDVGYGWGELNRSWKVARPGGSMPALDPAFVAAENAAGRTWLGHAVMSTDDHFIYGTSGQNTGGWYYITENGPLVRCQAQHYSSGDIDGLDTPKGISGVKTLLAFNPTTPAEVVAPLPLSTTLNASTAEFSGINGYKWSLIDMSDNGAVSLWMLPNLEQGFAVVTLGGEWPNITASVQAVSLGQQTDTNNFSTPLWARTYSAGTQTSVTDAGGITYAFSPTTKTERRIQAIGHDGTLLFVDTTWTHSGEEYHPYSDWVTRDTVLVATATFNGITMTTTLTNPPSTAFDAYYLAHASSIAAAPIVNLIGSDAAWPGYLSPDAPSQTLSAHDPISFYKSIQLSAYANTEDLPHYAVDPHTHEVFYWPTGVICV